MGEQMHTVLFADDTDEVRKLCCAVLQQHGCTVMEARDGYEALSLALDHPDPIDLLITDVVMPRLGGLDLCRAFKDCHPEARVLFISGYTAGQLDEGTTFLQKPFTPSQLRRRVDELLSEPECHASFRSDGLLV